MRARVNDQMSDSRHHGLYLNLGEIVMVVGDAKLPIAKRHHFIFQRCDLLPRLLHLTEETGV